ncbi:Uma2 family endonuclease [Dactylosporangium sp. CA-092794]|uniref:Uma2 family endonuclease n=1 Tax=Dactylosporangium sp. CA-092794 TaxID=3239929 RepID=UPI003D8A74BC
MRTAEMYFSLPDVIRPPGLFTLDDVIAIDATEGLRFELHEGIILMAPPPSPAHQEVDLDLALYFRRQGRTVYQGIGVVIDQFNYRIPDVVVLRPERSIDPDRNEQSADIVDIAVEIVSPSSGDLDRIVKPKTYAQAGIAQYWRVEPGPGGYVVFMHTLRDGAYAQTREVPLRDLVQ